MRQVKTGCYYGKKILLFLQVEILLVAFCIGFLEFVFVMQIVNASVCDLETQKKKLLS